MDENPHKNLIDQYSGTDSRSGTLAGFLEAMGIFARHLGDDEMEFLVADHDEVWCPVSIETLTPNSLEGVRLLQLGWTPDYGAGTWHRHL